MSLRLRSRLNELKDLRSYFLIIFIVVFGLNLNHAIFFLYPLSVGLNFLEMMFVYFSLTRIVYLAALIPTGAIADRLGINFNIYISSALILTGAVVLYIPHFGNTRTISKTNIYK